MENALKSTETENVVQNKQKVDIISTAMDSNVIEWVEYATSFEKKHHFMFDFIAFLLLV